MIMALPTMYRDTQNRYEPNLSFAQSLSPTMFRDNQNPNEPNLPFSQARPNPKHTYYYYIVNGDSIWFGKMTNARRLWTESNAGNYRVMGYDVRKESETKYSASGQEIKTGGNGSSGNGSSGNGSSGLTRTQVEKIIESYHGDDIALLHSHAVNFGKSLSSAKLHRDSIEGKVELGNTQRAEIHTKLTDLGRSVSDVSSALSVHSTHDLIPNPLGDILPYVLIGGVALLALRK